MSTSTEPKVQPNVFGNISKPRRSGILGLSLGQSMLGVPIVLVMIALIVNQHILAAVVLVLVSIVAAALVKVGVREGRSIYGRTMLRFAQRKKVRTKRHVYLSGPTGFTPTGDTRLPGLMAKSTLSEHADTYGTTFGMIRLSSRGHHNYSVVLQAFPEGENLLDQEQVDSRVAHWASWLTQRGLDEGIRGASVTVESAPDSGLRLQTLLAKNHRDDTPEFARKVIDEFAEAGVSGAPQLSVWVTLTFDGRRIDGKAGDRGSEEMAEEIGTKLPAILSAIGMAGAGAVRPCSAQDIVDFTRSAYDPTTASAIEEAQANGGTGLRWEDAGPSFAVDAFDYYRHDRAFSKTWTMYEGPRGSFMANSVQRLTAPTEGALRKRVTFLYRPIPADQTTHVVEREQKDALFAGSQTRISARAKQRLAEAQKTAQEEAMGSGMTRFGLIITVSVAEAEQLRRFDRLVPGLVSNAKLRVRPALANQAVAFQAGLPLGMVLPDHMVIPEELRTWF